MQSICKLLKTIQIQTTSYHPQANGSLERSHKMLAEYLHYVDEDQLNWDLWVLMQCLYLIQLYTWLLGTPYSLIHGREAEMPTSLTKGSPQPQTIMTSIKIR